MTSKINRLMKFFYRTNTVKNNNPENTLVTPSKILISNKDTLKPRNLNWFFSKRANLIIKEDQFSFKNTVITREAILYIDVFEYESSFLTPRYTVLKVTTNTLIYYFGTGEKHFNTLPKSVRNMYSEKSGGHSRIALIISFLLIILSLLVMHRP